MKPMFIFICGHMCSGKTTFTNKILSKFPNFNIINADLLRQYFRNSFPFYSDLDESYPVDKTEELNTIINPLRIEILNLLTKNNQHIILNKSSLSQKSRKEILDLIPNTYIKILIQTQINDEELLKRIQKRDFEGTHSKNWEIFHNKLRKNQFEKVSKKECEHILIYNQENSNEIFEYVNKLIK